MGPKEQTVRETLSNRPAGLLEAISREATRCFAGLFNGARSHGWIGQGGGLIIGKAECQWDWEKTWPELRDAGLITWTTEDRPNHPDFGGHTTHIDWKITDKGWDVREDDLRYFNELMTAMTDDEKCPA